MLDLPYLRAGRGWAAGSVLRAPGRRRVRMSGPAVVTGVPFDGEPVRLRVKWWDALGARDRAATATSADVKVKGRVVRLARPVPVPRLRVEPGVGVALRLARIGGRQAPPFPRRVVALANGDSLEVRRRSDGGCGRMLWSLPLRVLVKFTWDGRHAWFAFQQRLELRRLADGALVRVFECSLMTECRLSAVGMSPISFCFQPYEGLVLCLYGCCVWDLDLGSTTALAPPAVWCRGWSTASPSGDRIVTHASGTTLFYERTRADGFQAARLLPLQVRGANVDFCLTAAGELLRKDGCGVSVWHESRPTETASFQDIWMNDGAQGAPFASYVGMHVSRTGQVCCWK